jgi:hypothetical protein
MKAAISAYTIHMSLFPCPFLCFLLLSVDSLQGRVAAMIVFVRIGQSLRRFPLPRIHSLPGVRLAVLQCTARDAAMPALR